MRRTSPIRIQLGLSGWLAIIVVLIVLVVVAVASVYVVPALLALSALFYILRKSNSKFNPISRGQRRTDNRAAIIDAEFRVVDAHEIEGNTKSSDLGQP